MRLAIRSLPGAALFCVVVAVWAVTGTPVGSALLYTAAFAWSVTVPGLVLARLLRERHSLLEDLAVGTTVGFVCQLAAWAAFTALGIQGALIAWPLLVLVPVLASGRARQRLTLGSYPRTMHPATAWGLVVACLLPLATMGASMGRSRLPAAANAWYQDDYWHLALSAELMRAIPPELPQVAGGPFLYHWFANAHVATMTHITGLDLPLVFMRLWMPFVVITGLAMVVVAGRVLTGRNWPGVLAALMAGSAGAIWPAWFTMFGTSVFNVNSPSQQLSVALAMLAIIALIRILRGTTVGWGDWILLGIGAVGCSGAKASILPVVVCGLLLATAVSIVFNREPLRRLLATLGITAGVMVIALPLTSGGSAGVRLQLFASIRGTQPWSRMLGGTPPVSLESIPPGLDRAGAPALLLLLLVAYALAYGWLLSAVATLNRRDLSSWFLLGIGIAGWCAMMLLNQDGFSQVYFMSTAVLGWHLLMALGVFRAWEAGVVAVGVPRAAAVAVLGVASGWLVASFARRLSGGVPEPGAINSSIVAGLAPVLGVIALVLVGVLTARFTGRASLAACLWLGLAVGLLGAAIPERMVDAVVRLIPAGSTFVPATAVLALIVSLILVWRPATARTLGVAAVVTVTIAALVAGWLAVVDARAAHRRPVNLKLARTVTADETAAARWLQANSARDAVVATNVHCLAKKTAPNCDARAFWVGAFTERRVLVEGWAYTSEAHEAHGVNGLRYAQQPFHDQELFALNERAFADPSPEVLADLKDRGVTWLFADSAASAVSPQLAELAELALERGSVSVYKLN